MKHTSEAIQAALKRNCMTVFFMQAGVRRIHRVVKAATRAGQLRIKSLSGQWFSVTETDRVIKTGR